MYYFLDGWYHAVENSIDRKGLISIFHLANFWNNKILSLENLNNFFEGKKINF